ncbi:hypothetical protein CIW54_28985 [Paraburkholderia sp. T12-10]|nr:hypothetical protein CIW54_28985 [Paraburkholderia sp. T12-10]
MDEFGITPQAIADSIQQDLENRPVFRDARGNEWNGQGEMPSKRCAETVLTGAYFPPQRFQAMRNSAAFAARRSNSSALKSFPAQRR